MFASSGEDYPRPWPLRLLPRSVRGSGSAGKVAQPRWTWAKNPDRVGEALSHPMRTTRSGDGASPMPHVAAGICRMIQFAAEDEVCRVGACCCFCTSLTPTTASPRRRPGSILMTRHTHHLMVSLSNHGPRTQCPPSWFDKLTMRATGVRETIHHVSGRREPSGWIPAFAGMTVVGGRATMHRRARLTHLTTPFPPRRCNLGTSALFRPRPLPLRKISS